MRGVKERLDQVSPAFCAAKWLQVSLFLHTGHTRSCHHPYPHSIPPRGLAENPSLLHNTPFKKSMRQQMLSGAWPAECRICRETEGASPDRYSDRHIKSGDHWAWPFIGKIAALPWDADAEPSYVEVSFGMECGLRCMYCFPSVSSGVLADYKAEGPYPVTWPVTKGSLVRDNNFPAGLEPPPSDNVYTRAFWDWLPRIAGGLRVLRVSGGEPLLNHNALKVLAFLEQNPCPELELGFNSSLCVPDAVYGNFIARCKALLEAGKVREICLFTSLDAQGARSNYIRAGSDYDRIMANSRRWLEEIPDRTKLVFMCAFNILSFSSFVGLAGDVLELKRGYNRAGRVISLDAAILNDPYYLRPIIANAELAGKLREAIAFMRAFEVNDYSAPGFFPYEINKAERILDAVLRPSFRGRGLAVSRKDLARFIKEYDRRRGYDLNSVFPEMSAFIRDCGSLLNTLRGLLFLR